MLAGTDLPVRALHQFGEGVDHLARVGKPAGRHRRRRSADPSPLYERQGDWKSLSEPYPAFEAIAEEVGANTEQFQACIAEQRPRPRVRNGILSGARLGVRRTPSFLINGIPFVGAQPLELWADIFKVIEEAAGREGGGGGF